MDRRFDDLLAAHDSKSDTLLHLWDRLIELVGAEEQAEEKTLDDTTFAVLNRPVGHLARFLVSELDRRKPDMEAGLPEDLAQRTARLLALQGEAGLIASAGLMMNLQYLHAIDPDWAETTLLPLLSWSEPKTAAALWEVVVSNPQVGGERLFRCLKPNFLSAFGHPLLQERARSGLVDHLLSILLAQQEGQIQVELISNLEGKRALAVAGEAARTRAAYHMFDRMRNAGEEAAELWRAVVGPVFQSVWPMDAALQSGDSSLYLGWMATEAGNAFPDAIEAIRPALVATARAHHSMVEHLSDERVELYRRHPAAVLALMDGVVDPERPPRDLAERLGEIAAIDSTLWRDPRFERLWTAAQRA